MSTDASTLHPTDGVAQADPSTPARGDATASPAQAQQYPQAPHAAQYGAAPQLPLASQYPAGPQRAPGKNSYGYSIASFVLGIASIVSGWTFIAPIVGLVLGSLALKRNTPERTLALWGVWLNGVILGLAVLAVVLFITLASLGVMTGVFTGVFG